MDPVNGHLWATCVACEPDISLVEMDRNKNVLHTYPLAGFVWAGGVAVDGRSHVWAADGGGSEVRHFAPDPTHPGLHVEIGSIGGFQLLTNVTVDSNGKIWVVERDADRVSRIDPALGPPGPTGEPIGAVDLQVPFGGGRPVAYGDQSGFVALAGTAASDYGVFDAVFDSEGNGTPWGTAMWDAEVPLGTQVTVGVRAADDRLDLPNLPFFRDVRNGVPFTGIDGRFVNVRLTFERFDVRTSPVVHSVTIMANECFLLSSARPGSEPFQPGPQAHEFPTQLGRIKSWDPVLMERIPEFEIELPGPTSPAAPRQVPGSPASTVPPAKRFCVQIVMWNPGMFPDNPEQFTAGMEVSVWPDGTVSTRKYGTADGMDLEADVVGRTPGSVRIRFPFTIEGM